MKDSWKIVKLREVAEYHKEQGVFSDLQYIGMENMESGTGRILQTVDSSTMKSTSFKFQEGEVLYGRLRPYLKKVYVAEFDGCCSTEVFPIKTKGVLPHFLKYWFLTDEVTNALVKTSAGCRMPRANMNEALDFEFPLPPLEEQKSIVKRLDEAFEKIARARENVEKSLAAAKELFQSELSKLIGGNGKLSKLKIDNGKVSKLKIDNGEWKIVKLGDVAEIMYGYTAPSTNEKLDYHYLRITDIQNNCVDWNSVPYCQCSADDVKKYKLVNGDIVFARTGATTGKSFLIENDIPNSLFASYLIRVQLKDKKKNLPKFIRFYFDSKEYWDLINSGISGSAQGGFNATKLAGLSIPLPPLDEQKSIVARLDSLTEQISRLDQNYTRILADCDELKQSILAKTFDN